MPVPWMILDIATAPANDAAQFITPAAERDAPDNYKDPEKIKAWQQAAFDKDVERAGADLDLAQITGAAFWTIETGLKIGLTYGDPVAEQKILGTLASVIDRLHPEIITYNGSTFDLPMLLRRAAYLGIRMPFISLDRYRSPHIDAYELLTNRGRLKARPLEWYVKRFGLDLIKPLSGEQEAQVIKLAAEKPEVWDLLKQSLRHDVVAIARIMTLFGFGEFPEAPSAPAPPPPDPPVG